MKIGGQTFENHTYVMAIVNLTPDSFYAPSRKTVDDVLFAVERAQSEGASVIDLGAQSTRPGHVEVSADEELRRLLKPLEAVKSRFQIPVSVDTYYSRVAREALMRGADMINDIWGFQRDENMAQTVAGFGAAACLMHNSNTPLTGDIWGAIENFLEKSAQIAVNAGVDKGRIILDGGIGFAKSREQNFELLNGYERLKKSGFPLLLGTSRKSMFGGLPEERLPQTLESTLKACEKGVLFVRVHDVKENFEAIENFYKKAFN